MPTEDSQEIISLKSIQLLWSNPFIKSLADEIVRQNEVDSIQNWILVGLVGAVGGAIIFALAYQYLRKKAFAKIAAGQAPGIPLAPQNAIRRTNQDLEADVWNG